MYDAEGVGLAAPQVGISKRVIVVDIGDENGLIEMVNPEIVEMDGEQLGPEGCLSIPNLNGDVRQSAAYQGKRLKTATACRLKWKRLIFWHGLFSMKWII